MKLDHLRQHWDELGSTDPLWAILSDASDDLDEFFERGRREVARQMKHLDDLGIAVRRCRALDFGCGMGRLTQALCEHFDQCDGVDIAPSMLALANQRNRFGDRCQYTLNTADDLRVFPDAAFDMVYTNLVLQHMRPRYALAYVGEFFRVLRPGGVALFQAPGEVTPTAGPAPRPVPNRKAGLPAEARRAAIKLVDPPTHRPTGLQFEQRVVVRNAGSHTWPASRTVDGKYELVVGSRWFDAQSGACVEEHDGRALLPHDLAPGGGATLRLIATAPDQSGAFRLEVDVVEEGVGRFGQPATADVITFTPEDVDASPTPACIQMYGLGTRTIFDLVEGLGGRMLAMVENTSAGEWWTSRMFCCRAGGGGEGDAACR